MVLIPSNPVWAGDKIGESEILGSGHMGRSRRWVSRRTCILLICLIFFGTDAAIAKPSPPPKDADNTPVSPGVDNATLIKKSPFVEADLTLTTGIRKDELEWSIAGNGIDLLSELSWSDVDSYQVSVAGHAQFQHNVYFRGQFNYAWVIDGSVRDSDYGQDGQRAEWSRSISESTGDQLWDFTMGGGYAFFFLHKRLIVSPLLGVSYHKQNLRIQNGAQVLSETNPFGGSNPPGVGPLSSQLNSSYFARWAGPWIGCDLRYTPKMDPPIHHSMEFRFSMELHWADYYGEGNWNLRGDLAHPKSFEHEADGFGISLTGQWLINMGNQWDITFTASHQEWSTDRGVDRKFLSSGGSSTTKLNGVEWDSTSFMVGAAYHF